MSASLIMRATSSAVGSGGSDGPTATAARGRSIASASSATGRVTTIFKATGSIRLAISVRIEVNSGHAFGDHARGVERLTTSHRGKGARGLTPAKRNNPAVDEIGAHNARMWERLAKAGIPYTRPQGNPPRDAAGKRRFLDRIAFGALKGLSLEGKRVLSLAGGGGWDPILFAELGADTTLVDISATQLETVRRLARRRGTTLTYLRADMRDLSALGSGEFDIIFHQHSLVFVPDAERVIGEVARVLAYGGTYVFSTMHPVTFLFYEGWTGAGWRPKKPYFSDRPVPVLRPTWDFGRVKVHAPTYEYAHRTADLVNACAEVGLIVDGLWEWSPHYDGGPEGSDDALARELPAYIQVRARMTSSWSFGA